MTTETAQRRLREALAELHNTPDLDIGEQSDPLGALHIGIVTAADMVAAMGQPALAGPFAAFAALVAAVREDYREVVSND